MSKLVIDQKTVKTLLGDNKADFLIPDYQRPYAWEAKECQTLWDDIFAFAFPDNDCDKFDRQNDMYFLGPVVTYLNSDKRQEIIDGQQRLTTLMLLLRAFHKRYGNMKDDLSLKTRQNIEKCIWKTDEFDKPDYNALKLESEVATDEAKQELEDILRTGDAPDSLKSQYAQNYRFFQEKINAFLEEYPSYFAYLPTRILNNCILLPIEAESQDTALRIFSTLNDRGKPLSDSDIFKAQFYKYYSQKGQKDAFIARWKQLDELCSKIFNPIVGTPMDEAFTRYMYYERAKQGNKSTTTEALRKFYERNNYELLKKDETFDNLIDLVNFWNDVELQNKDRFDLSVLRRLFVLNYAPNGMWAYIVSVYYLTNRAEDGSLDDAAFCEFLDKITAFIWAYAVTNPGVNALRAPLYAEMINIVEGVPVSLDSFRFNLQHVTDQFKLYTFSNNRAITRAMLTWWAFQNNNQELLPLEMRLDIEHIYPRNRQEKEHSLTDGRNIESLGNKALLEKRINITASDYRFADKKKYYNGYQNLRKQWKDGTKIQELKDLAAAKTDFQETDIVQRKEQIILAFTTFLKACDLSKE